MIGQFSHDSIGRKALVKVTEDETDKSSIEALHPCKTDIKIFLKKSKLSPVYSIIRDNKIYSEIFFLIPDDAVDRQEKYFGIFFLIPDDFLRDFNISFTVV